VARCVGLRALEIIRGAGLENLVICGTNFNECFDAMVTRRR